MIRITATKSVIAQVKKSLEVNKVNKNFRNIAKLQSVLAVISEYDCTSVAEIIGYSEDTVRVWINEFLLCGLDFLKNKKSKGRPSKLSATQKMKLKEMIKDGPEAMGFDGGCWRTPMIQHLIEKNLMLIFLQNI